MVRGNKYPSVRDRKQLQIWKQTHRRGLGPPQLAAKHQVTRGAGGPTSRVTAASLPEPQRVSPAPQPTSGQIFNR